MIRRRIAHASFVLSFCFGSLARAEPAPPSEAAPKTEEQTQKELKARIDEARRAYQAGELSYQAGDFKAAIENFTDAERLVPTPHATFWLAMSYQKDGRVPEAIASFERLLNDPNASKIGDEKVEDAKSTLAALKKTPGKLTLSSNPVGASVSVDGQKKPGVTPLELELSPGRHKLSLFLAGHDTLEVEMEVPPGSSSKQAVDLPEATPPPAAAAATPPLAPRRQKSERRSTPPAPRNRTGAWVMVGAAGAATVVGGVFGVMALSAKGRYDDHANSNDADAVSRNAMLSDIAFGSAITLGLASVVMFTTSDSDERPPSSAKRAPTRHVVVTPIVSTKAAGTHVGWDF